MRTVELEVFKYEELSDKAKEKARDWFRQGDDFYPDCMIEDADNIALMMGIQIKQQQFRTIGGKQRTEPAIQWSGFHSQGDGASFEGTYSPLRFPVAEQSVKSHAPQDEELHAIAATLDRLQNKYGNRLSAKVSFMSSRYSHSGVMQVDATAEDDNGDEVSVLEDEQELQAALRSFADWIWNQLRREYEYQTSDETVAENITANDYEFTADGEAYP